MKYAYLFVCVLLSLTFAATCNAGKSPCDGGACPVPAFRTLTIEIPAVAVVATAPKERASRPVVSVAAKAVKAPARLVQAVREREHKPVVRAVQAIRERERRPLVKAVQAVRERKPIRNLLRRR